MTDKPNPFLKMDMTCARLTESTVRMQTTIRRAWMSQNISISQAEYIATQLASISATLDMLNESVWCELGGNRDE